MLKSEFIKRKNETDRVRLKYPERVPVMVFKSPIMANQHLVE